jgi:integrase
MRRPSEIRLIRIQDLDLERVTVRIEFPKCGGSWAAPSTVTIMGRYGPVHPAVPRRPREAPPGARQDVDHAVPKCVSDGDRGRYSKSKFNEIKRDVEQQADVRFLIKDFRSSSATDVLDRDSKAMAAISTQMGHKYEDTTQDRYARVKQGRVGEELRKLLNPVSTAPKIEQKPKVPGPKSHEISTKTPVVRTKLKTTG